MATRTFTSQIVLGKEAVKNLEVAIEKSTPVERTLNKYPKPEEADEHFLNELLEKFKNG